MSYTLPNGSPVSKGVQFSIGDKTYPSNWLALASTQDLADAGIIATEDPAPTPPSLSLAEQKTLKTTEIELAVNTAMAPILSVYSTAERDTWAIQESEAVTWTADNAAQTPMLTALATQRGMTIADLAASVLVKSAEFKALAGETFGKRRAKIDEINAEITDTAEKVSAITW